MASLITISTLLSLALAQTTTITLPFLAYEEFPIHASVVSAKPSQTIFALACPSGTDGSDCGFFPQQLLTYGPSTYVMDMSEPGDDEFSMTQDCSIGVATATCKESASGSEANFPGSSTETYEGEEVTHLPVTITAGANKLAANADATPTPDASSSKGSSSAVATTGGSASATLATSTRAGASASNSSSVAPAENTGAADRSMVSKVGLVGAAAGLFAGLLL